MFSGGMEIEYWAKLSFFFYVDGFLQRLKSFSPLSIYKCPISSCKVRVIIFCQRCQRFEAFFQSEYNPVLPNNMTYLHLHFRKSRLLMFRFQINLNISRNPEPVLDSNLLAGYQESSFVCRNHVTANLHKMQHTDIIKFCK